MLSDGTQESRKDRVTSIHRIDLRIRDIERQIRFYHDALGLYVRIAPGGWVNLSDEQDGITRIGLTRESSESSDRERPARSHRVGLKFRAREALATTVARLVRHGIPIDATADRGGRESVYTRDAEGNAIELYWHDASRLSEQEPATPALAGQPLDLNELLADEIQSSLPVISGTRIGNVSLPVASVDRSIEFYGQILGNSVVRDDNDGATVDLGADGQFINLFPATEGQELAAPENATGLMRIALRVSREDLDGIYEIATDARVISRELGEWYEVADPDGLVIQMTSDPS